MSAAGARRGRGREAAGPSSGARSEPGIPGAAGARRGRGREAAGPSSGARSEPGAPGGARSEPGAPGAAPREPVAPSGRPAVNVRGVALVSAAHVVDDIYQGVVPALLPFLVAERHYSYAAVSGITLAATVLSSVAQPAFGVWADRRSRRWMIGAGMLLAAVADPDPVMIFEHKLLYKMKGPVPEGHYTVPIGKADIRREGRDLTIVATSIMVHKALEAAAALEAEGIDIEVIDLRSIRPMDKQTIIDSVKKTSRLLCVYEAVKTLGIGAEVSAMIAESEAFDYLDAPIVRLGGAETPIPYNPELEKATVPQVPGIVAAARDLVKGRR